MNFLHNRHISKRHHASPPSNPRLSAIVPIIRYSGAATNSATRTTYHYNRSSFSNSNRQFPSHHSECSRADQAIDGHSCQQHR
ncbi:hypothetical protein L484_023359 [Morus notabilis]|uniref:Uncharacterized protein n=1 Tax=Morus notabilis TaxID=981085 RepID=W9SU61_9ROSA|nr:hypothetical protein L484_023359 [Morus notabilis]